MSKKAAYIAYLSLMIILIAPAASAISLNIGLGSGDGQSRMSTSYDLDSSSELTSVALLEDGAISSSRSLTGRGNNSIAHASFNSMSVVAGNISTSGSLVSSASSYVSSSSASLDQRAYAEGLSKIGSSGRAGTGETSQESGAVDGAISSLQAVSAHGNVLSAVQSSRIGASAGYISSEAVSPNSSTKVTGGLNGAGNVSGTTSALASDTSAAQGSFDAGSLQSKSYAAALATSGESGAFSYASSNESLSSDISASASRTAEAKVSQGIISTGGSLIYASASHTGASEDSSYSGRSQNAAKGGIYASTGQASGEVDASLEGDIESGTRDISPVPGSWVWSGLGGYMTSNPFMIRDSLGQRHIFARGEDNGLWDNLDGDWTSLGGRIASDPYAVSDDRGRIHILARQGDNSVADNVLNPYTLNSTWYNLGGDVRATPSAVLAPGGSTMSILCRGKEGDLVLKRLDTSVLPGAEPIDQAGWVSLGGFMKSAPWAEYDGSGRMHIFARGGNDALWDNVDGSWICLGGSISSDARPLMAPLDKMQIYTYARGIDGSLVCNIFNTSSGGSAWSNLGGYMPHGPGIFDGTPSPVADSSGMVHVYVRGDDGGLWENAGGVWRSIGGALTSDPSAVNSDGLLEVAVRGGDGSLYLAQPEVYGSWPNPTGNPIGGGDGYKKSMSRSDASYVVEDRAGLMSALASATPGQTVYIDDNARIDLTGSKNIIIPSGVTLASGRGTGGSQGALLYVTNSWGLASTESSAVFWAGGPGVRVSGIRLCGPSGERDLTSFARGIWSRYPGFAVDNCEIYNFPHAGIVLASGATSSEISHNYIHNCRGEMGYGVVLGAGDAVAMIRSNLFDYDRHAIAAGGTPGNSYTAEYNTVLEHDGAGHSFDVHGGSDRRDGTTIAGSSIKIDHNTFEETYYRNIVIRGVPQQGAWIYNNWFYNPDPGSAIAQTKDFGNISIYNNLFGM